MGLQRMLITAVAATTLTATLVRAELNECLGIEMCRVHAIPTCAALYTAVEVGVNLLNEQLQRTSNAARLSPVSVVSASESRGNSSDSTLVAMLVQLAPIDKCIDTPGVAESTASTTCLFDMTQLELYSVLVTLDDTMRWTLDGYQHHAITEAERSRVATQYKAGAFFGSNLALGIFDAPPSLPLESATTAQGKPLVRSSLSVLFVLASAGLSVGLLFHHRRRLSNGYAPIVIVKHHHQQQQQQGGAAGGETATNAKKKKTVNGSTTPPSSALERVALRQANPVSTNEDMTIKHEQNERFAV